MSDRVPEDVPPAPSEAGRLNDGVLRAGTTTHKLVGTTAGEERDDNALKMKFVWCPPGEFMMGSTENEQGRRDDENQVQVRLTQGFWLGKYEVTQGEWERLMGTAPWKGEDSVEPGPRYPANYVSWYDATDFVEKLTIQERQAGRLPVGWRYTLPTEAQWEYACRAGTQTPYGFGTDEAQLSDYDWWGAILGGGNAAGEPYAHEVGSKKPNAWGLHDLHGNVFEWCRDWYHRELSGGVDPEPATEAPVRVMRGGSWLSHARFSRSADREWLGMDTRCNDCGFRVVCSCEP
jgi:formylglycine-generating enzyme required for sulfatase activity